MGIAVYLEDQIHGRTYAGAEAGVHLSKLLSVAGAGGLLSGIHPYGDTMFNINCQSPEIVEGSSMRSGWSLGPGR